MLALWEELGLPFIVVAKLTVPVQRLVRGNLVWHPTELAGTDVASPARRRIELKLQEVGGTLPEPAEAG